MQIHRLSPQEAIRALGTSEQGLTEAEAARRLDEFGHNELRAAEKIPYLAMLGKQFTHFFAALLWAAAALAFAADWMKPGEGMGLLGWAIIGVIVVNALFGIDLGTDMLPALGLGAEPPDKRTMDRPPRSGEERLLNLPLLARSYLFLGPIEAAAAIGAGLWCLADGGWEWGASLSGRSPLYMQATTVTFAAIVVCQVANVFACRSTMVSSSSLGFLTNRLLLRGVVVELALLGLIVYHPVGHRIFGTAPFDGRFWWLLLVSGAILLLAEEGRKGLLRRRAWGKGLRYQERAV